MSICAAYSPVVRSVCDEGAWSDVKQGRRVSVSESWRLWMMSASSTPRTSGSRRSRPSPKCPASASSPWRRCSSPSTSDDRYVHKQDNQLQLTDRTLKGLKMAVMKNRRQYALANRMSDCCYWRSIFLHSELMQALDVTMGQMIGVTKDKGESEENVCLTVYPIIGPDPSLSALVSSEVMKGFNDDNVTNVVVTLRPVDQKIDVIRRLQLAPIEDDINLEALCLKQALKDVVLSSHEVVQVPHFGRVCRLKVQDLLFCLDAHMASLDISESLSSPERKLGIVSNETEVIVLSKDVEAVSQVHFEEVVGGLDRQIDQLGSWLNHLLMSKSSSHGILLHGPSGVGKSLLGRHLNHLVTGSKLICMTADELWTTQTENPFEAMLIRMQRMNGPTIVFIDDLDHLCPSAPKGERGEQMLMAFRSMMNKLKSMKTKVAIVAAVSNLNALHSSLRRAALFNRDLEISAPDRLGREQILGLLLRPHADSVALTVDDINVIAASTHAFVGSDLQLLIEEARNLASNQNETKLSLKHVQSSFQRVKPSAMREVFVEVPNITWSDVGGMDELKLALKQAVEWPLKRNAEFKKFGVAKPKGLLMYGPPGCSKTLIAQALATESGLNFLSIKGPELFSKWVGESERAVRDLFRKARNVAPSLIFFDEIDALGSERGSSNRVGDRVLAQMLTEMDGIEALDDVTVVAATNRPDLIDDALMRPGRLDRLFYVPLPDALTRLQVLKVHTRNKPLSPDVCLEQLVAGTEGYSGAEVSALCNEAALEAMQEENCDQVMMRHFDMAIQRVKPRIRPEVLLIYEQYRKGRQTAN